MENCTIKCIETCWFWQVKKILNASKFTYSWLGYYSWNFNLETKEITGTIEYIDIKPWIGKRTLIHEKGHHYVLTGVTSAVEASERTKEYDEVTKHGLLQWRAKKLYRKYGIE